MNKLINEVLKSNIWAVVGATTNEAKFGYKIFMRLKNAGYEVYPVNPMYDEIDGDKCYDSVEDLPVKPDCVDMVVSPKRGKAMLEGMKLKGVENVWFQPGTYDDEIIELFEENGFKLIYDHCVLVEL